MHLLARTGLALLGLALAAPVAVWADPPASADSSNPHQHRRGLFGKQKPCAECQRAKLQAQGINIPPAARLASGGRDDRRRRLHHLPASGRTARRGHLVDGSRAGLCGCRWRLRRRATQSSAARCRRPIPPRSGLCKGVLLRLRAVRPGPIARSCRPVWLPPPIRSDRLGRIGPRFSRTSSASPRSAATIARRSSDGKAKPTPQSATTNRRPSGVTDLPASKVYGK